MSKLYNFILELPEKGKYIVKTKEEAKNVKAKLLTYEEMKHRNNDDIIFTLEMWGEDCG